MTLQDLGSIGEFAGALLVMVSLIYLALQIRQNTHSLRASSYQETVRAANEWSSRLVNHPETVDIFLRGRANRSSLEDGQRVEFDQLMLSFLRNYGAAFYLSRVRFVPPSISEGYERAVRQFFASDQMRSWLSKNEWILEEDVRTRVQRLLAA